jgi:putative exporter of polyketide antibiotics
MKDYFKYSFTLGILFLLFVGLHKFLGFLFPNVLRIFEVGFAIMGVFYVLRSIYIGLRRWGVSK